MRRREFPGDLEKRLWSGKRWPGRQRPGGTARGEAGTGLHLDTHRCVDSDERYNGYFIAYAADGTPAGYLDYQSASGDDQVLIAMVEVRPAHRRQGLATLLLARLREEFPGRTVRPCYQTADVAGWWRAVGRRQPGTTGPDDNPAIGRRRAASCRRSPGRRPGRTGT